MKKFLAITAVLLFLLVIAGVVGARLLYQNIVESDDFRIQVSVEMTRAVQGFVKNATVEVTSVKVAGLVDVATGPVLIRSGEPSSQTITIESARVRPDIWSLISSGPVQVNADLELEGGGTATVNGKIAPSLFIDPQDPRGFVEVTGKINEASAVPLVTMMLTAQKDPYFSITEGRMDGSFHYLKKLGPASAVGNKQGYFTVNLTNTKWMIAADSKRVIAIDQLPVDLTLTDFLIELRQPVKLVDDSGTATITGAVNLPRYREEEKSWNLAVLVAGSDSLLAAVGQLFKCAPPPVTPDFLVQGSFSAARCKPAPPT